MRATLHITIARCGGHTGRRGTCGARAMLHTLVQQLKAVEAAIWQAFVSQSLSLTTATATSSLSSQSPALRVDLTTLPRRLLPLLHPSLAIAPPSLFLLASPAQLERLLCMKQDEADLHNQYLATDTKKRHEQIKQEIADASKVRFGWHGTHTRTHAHTHRACTRECSTLGLTTTLMFTAHTTFPCVPRNPGVGAS